MPSTCQTCPSCSRANPAEAVYCYFDGFRLANHIEAPTTMGSRRFLRPFVLASRRACHSFDELALACFDLWEEAREALANGLLERFLGESGRLDLAQAACEAARFPDPDRGLDQLLDRLPATVLAPPALRVEPEKVNLAALRPHEPRRFPVRIVNSGQRLLYGTLSTDADWLALGTEDGGPEKHFLCTTQTVVVVYVRPHVLRANDRPLVATIEVKSCAGQSRIEVRAEVPVIPFPTGLLAGARTPREAARRIRESPREGAAYLEDGSVARWYTDNGWTYPVQVAPATGLGAVQQFFEALGLTSPPQVAVQPPALVLRGPARGRVQQSLRLQALEKRPVWAHGVSDQDWLKVGQAQLDGAAGLLPLSVPVVPDQPGTALQGQVRITTNGKKRIVVPVTLVVEAPVQEPIQPQAPQSPVRPMRSPAQVEPVQIPSRARRWLVLVPGILLALVLLGIVGRDFFIQHAAENAARTLGATPLLELRFHEAKTGDRLDALLPQPSMRFGLLMTGPGSSRRLTADPWGRTNNTCLRIDGQDRFFGVAPGRWAERSAAAWRLEHKGEQSTWEWPDQQVRATQFVELVRGEESNRFDTCLVRYLIENDGKAARQVGLRFLLDTFIGSNDGVPFTIPGERDLCADARDLQGKGVPPFLQAVEREDLANPGTVAHLKLRLGDREPPVRVTLGAWPDEALDVLLGLKAAQGIGTLWDVPVRPMKTLFPYDSAVAIYWMEKPLPPGTKREIAFAYGLGSVASGGKLLLTVDGRFKPAGELVVTVLVNDPAPGETVTLAVPAGFEVQGPATQAIPAVTTQSDSRNRPVTWNVRAGSLGEHEFVVRSSTGAEQKKIIRIKQSSIFD